MSFAFTTLLLLSLTVTGAYPDPILTESGGEAIQFENTGDEPVDLTGVLVQTKGGTVPLPAATLMPGSSFLLADTGWSLSKDNASWPDADLEATLSLANTESWVSLVDGAGETLDTLAWGPAGKPREGKLWTPDGEATPRFRNSSAMVTTVPAMLIITDGPPRISQITVTDDSAVPGIQLLGFARSITIEATVEEPNGEAFTVEASVAGERATLSRVNNTSRYRATVPLPALSEGDYTLVIRASDATAIAEERVGITVLRTSVLTAEPVRFAGVPGQAITANITVRNDGNTPRAVTIERTPFGAVCALTEFTLPRGESRSVPCTVVIPLGVPGEQLGRFAVLAV